MDDHAMPGFDDRIRKILRSLMRHRERYVKAWMAHYKAHPSDIVLKTTMGMNEVTFLDWNIESPRIQAVIACAQRVVDEDAREDVSGDTLADLKAALEALDITRRPDLEAAAASCEAAPGSGPAGNVEW
jgi:hypothetical protein